MSIQPQQRVKSLVNDEGLFDSTVWSSVNTKGISNASEEVLLDEEDWMEVLEDSMEDDELPIVPIKTTRGREYVKIIKYESENRFAGIGIKFHVTKQLLDGYVKQYYGIWISQDVIHEIRRFCSILKISAIYLDYNYIVRQHQLLMQSQNNMNFMDISDFKQFITNLSIIEEGEVLAVQSDWSDQEATHKQAV